MIEYLQAIPTFYCQEIDISLFVMINPFLKDGYVHYGIYLGDDSINYVRTLNGHVELCV